MIMEFKMGDLQKIPAPKKGGKKFGAKIISVQQKKLYFPKAVVDTLKLKDGMRCAFRIMPNNKGLVLDFDGDDYMFAAPCSKTDGTLTCAGIQVVEYIRENFKTNRLTYFLLGDTIILVPAKEEKK